MKLFIYLGVVILFLAFSCSHKPTIEDRNKDTELAGRLDPPISRDTLAKKDYLRNRIPDCEQRISYMKDKISYVENSESTPTGFNTSLGYCRIKVEEEYNENKLEDLHHFYFDFECFKGQHYSTLLEILMPPAEYSKLDEIFKKSQVDNFLMEGRLDRMSCFSFRISNDTITSYGWCKRNN